jgi:hypothetical protein
MNESTTPQLAPDGSDGAIHNYFELSYCNYLTLPRSLLQSMHHHWQDQFVALLEELQSACHANGAAWPLEDGYAFEVRIRKWDNDKRKFVGAPQHDEMADYEHGRRRLW